MLLRFYLYPALSEAKTATVLRRLQPETQSFIDNIETEYSYYISSVVNLNEGQIAIIKSILARSHMNGVLSAESRLVLEANTTDHWEVLEVGPRLTFSTPFSTNVTNILRACCITEVTRVERSIRYRFHTLQQLSAASVLQIAQSLHDPMTECVYAEPLSDFGNSAARQAPIVQIDVLGKGIEALTEANSTMGLAFDDWDLSYYTSLFVDTIKRNPTNVECFDLAQSNSEHSRHWFFRARLMVDGVEWPQSLFDMVMATQSSSNPNNILKFCDNSSAIIGYQTKVFHPQRPDVCSVFLPPHDDMRHVIFTAETHNFPTGVSPFPGASTGTGGRIRDVHATGRGAHVIAGTAGYCFGNLLIPGYDLPWEDTFAYPTSFARPLEICIEASNGASDYGNKFGEPVIGGFCRSFGMQLVAPDSGSSERIEWIKPIMFSGGVGALSDRHVAKATASAGMAVAKIGGPVYAIGVGGGSASSVQVQGDTARAGRDFGAVQRGDPEMEQKLNRLIRGAIEDCSDHSLENPILAIHDQGAGGNGNVLKELCAAAGAHIHANRFDYGDESVTSLELWGAEYQESNAILVSGDERAQRTLRHIGRRERCPISWVGDVTDDGRIRLDDNRADVAAANRWPVDLPLDCVLAKMPRKLFQLLRVHAPPPPLVLPLNLKVQDAIERVLRLPSVGSKRFLTNKVDRSVTGLVAQQQCVGPLNTPLADVAVVALSYFDTVGAATAIGEQPVKTLVDAPIGGRLAVAEAMTNLVFAAVTELRDVKCSGNWMWPAKLAGEGARLLDCCRAMCDFMQRIGVAVDGGKDSLSMAAKLPSGQTVKSPGSLVVSAYVTCPDIRCVVTPALRAPDDSGGCLLWVPFAPLADNLFLDGTALAQCYAQLGAQLSDCNDAELFVRAFNCVNQLVTGNIVLAGHDVSDGGLLGCLLEMAFAGNCGLDITLEHAQLGLGRAEHDDRAALRLLFAEVPAVILELLPANCQPISDFFTQHNVSCFLIGHSVRHLASNRIVVRVDNQSVIDAPTNGLRDSWELTSYRLERLQMNDKCADSEYNVLQSWPASNENPYKLTFEPDSMLAAVDRGLDRVRPCVAVIREEGSNGDREMAAAFYLAGFDVWDVNSQDLVDGLANVMNFDGVAFVGGFSYADVLGAANGWASALTLNDHVRLQLERFNKDETKFSLGVCNGCQLMARLGWLNAKRASDETDDTTDVYVEANESGRFESRWSLVRVESASSLWLDGMAGSVLGVWVAHGEGRFAWRSDAARRQVPVAMSFVAPPDVTPGHRGLPAYPFNPNGSPDAAAALLSPDGRHLAVMPHPERCLLAWQWPYWPPEWLAPTVKPFHAHHSPHSPNVTTVEPTFAQSPWIRLFQNAFVWSMRRLTSLAV